MPAPSYGFFGNLPVEVPTSMADVAVSIKFLEAAPAFAHIGPFLSSFAAQLFQQWIHAFRATGLTDALHTIHEKSVVMLLNLNR